MTWLPGNKLWVFEIHNKGSPLKASIGPGTLWVSIGSGPIYLSSWVQLPISTISSNLAIVAKFGDPKCL